jgi:hypothetical protein
MHIRALVLLIVAWLALLPATRAADATVQVAELTPDVEQAIEKGLEWLVRTQAADGSWGTDYKTASTALGLMAFMVKGHFTEKPPYGDTLSKAVTFLLSTANDGYMGKSMYEHGAATLALSEVWGMSSREEIPDALKRAVNVILRSQSPAGGWRYNPMPTDADLSVTVMQIVALASAKEAGILVPDATLQKAIAYVISCQHQASGGFGYQPAGEPGFERSAAGVMSLMMCGQRESPAVKAGLAYLLKQPGAVFSDSAQYYYGHYYAVQGMYQAGDVYYQEWYPRIRDAMLKRQGPEGNWPDAQGIGTPMAILVLGVPYRFLPIYQR